MKKMLRLHRIGILAAVVLLGMAACSLPGAGPMAMAPTFTPVVYVTILIATPTPAEASATPLPPTATAPPSQETPTPTLPTTPTPTPTSRVTRTPRPTRTPRATATIKPGPPLSFLDPAWEYVEWRRIPETEDWQGFLRARITGGTAPYRAQLENNDIVDGLEVPARWRLCSPMPATLRVWSADGQAISATIWVWEVGCD